MTVEEKLAITPTGPGVYIFRDSRDRILYIGKAKNLRARLRSYFQKAASLDARKASMVRRVSDFSWLVTDTELEALALEANLIKQHRPQFNIILRDDKNYPYLKLTVQEEWPRIEVVRKIVHDGSLYFGPFVPAGAMWEMLAFIRRHFRIRPCAYRLDRPMRPCVEHEMGRCPAPCEGRISRQEYMKAIEEARLFLEGRKDGLVRELEEKMRILAGQERFEEAAVLRDKLSAIRRAFEEQKVILPELGDIDVIGCSREGSDCAFQVFFIRNGIMTGARSFHLKRVGDMPQDELLRGFVEVFYAKEIIPPPEIVVAGKPLDEAELAAWLSKKRQAKVRFLAAKRGKKKELLSMAERNAAEFLRVRKASPEHRTLEEIKERFSLRQTPESIGAFDVSTIHGAHSVGSFVYWSEGGFRKDMYRHLKIKGVTEKADDYAMMEETVGRVLADLGEERPDLILIDGGRGQLEAATKALSGLGNPPEAISIAKEPDRVFLPDAAEPIDIEDARPSSLLLKRIRDEAHRFAVAYHKKLRDKRLMESPLLGIKGIGSRKRLELLRHFGSLDAIKSASVEELSRVKGIDRKLAESIKKFLGEMNSDKMGL